MTSVIDTVPITLIRSTTVILQAKELRFVMCSIVGTKQEIAEFVTSITSVMTEEVELGNE